MRILYLDIDTLRPDHLGCYGYNRDTSPNIDWIASQGVRCDRVYCSDAPCLPSRTALMTGRFGIHNGVVNHAGTAADLRIEGPKRDFRDRLWCSSLPGFLHESVQLHTCFIGGFGKRHSSWSFYAGFCEIHDTGLGGHESAEDVTPTVLDWIDRRGSEDNWFLHVNYWDPHTPYRAPEEFGNPFKDSPLPDLFTDELIASQHECPGPHTMQDIGMYQGDEDPKYPRQPGAVHDMAGMRRLIDGYDCGIRYVDSHVGQLLKAFEAQGVLDDLVIIVSADHGENFGELGLYAEHGTADEGTCHIPMIIRWPGMLPAGAVDDGFHYNLDLSPTLAQLLDKPACKEWEGRSYASALQNDTDAGRPELIIGQCAHGAQRSVRWDKWMYIRTWHDGLHLFPQEMLFDIEKDPHEQNDLSQASPDLIAEGRRRLENWRREMMTTMPEGYTEDPLDTVLRELPFHARTCPVADYTKRLKETGRAQGLKELRARHPEVFG